MLRIHTRLHRTPLATLSNVAPCYHSGSVLKDAQNALDAPMHTRPEDIPYPISFDLDHLYLLIYIAYILRYMSTISKDIYPTRPKGIDRTIYPPIPKHIQNFLGELEKLLGATKLSRSINYSRSRLENIPCLNLLISLKIIKQSIFCGKFIDKYNYHCA